MAPKGGFDGINLIVGGIYYSLTAGDVQRFPDSYFAHLLKDEWNADKNSPVRIDRDGALFRHIHYFIYTDSINVDLRVVSNITDLKAVLEIKREADFYNLPALVQLCNDNISYDIHDWGRAMISQEHNQSFLAVTQVCECVAEGTCPPTDPLVEVLSLLRPPSVATARLDSYPQDTLTRSIGEALRSSAMVQEPNFRSCMYNFSTVEKETQKRLERELAVWPLSSDPDSILIADIGTPPKVFIYQEHAECTLRLKECTKNVLGTILYILNSPFTGGTISSSINGHKVSISQPGECMALLPGCTYSVEAVTSGALLLVEYDVPSAQDPDWPPVTSSLKWTIHNPAATVIGDSLKASICTALDATLDNYDGVVYCLSQYYDIEQTANPSRHFETNPDSLVGMDAILYNMFYEYYDVEVVTVYTELSDNYQVVSRAAVLDFIYPVQTDSAMDTISDTNSGSTHNSIANTVEAKVNYKVICPRYGFGRAAPVETGHSVRTKEWVSALTGLLITQILKKKSHRKLRRNYQDKLYFACWLVTEEKCLNFLF